MAWHEGHGRREDRDSEADPAIALRGGTALTRSPPRPSPAAQEVAEVREQAHSVVRAALGARALEVEEQARRRAAAAELERGALRQARQPSAIRKPCTPSFAT